MVKVKGSNLGFAIYFSQNRLHSLDKNESMQSELDRVESSNLDFQRQGRTTAIDRLLVPILESFVSPSFRSFVLASPAGVPRNVFEE